MEPPDVDPGTGLWASTIPLAAPHVTAAIVLGGRKGTVTRPRAPAISTAPLRSNVPLKNFNAEDLLREMALERMLAGLSTRNYPAGLEPVGDIEAIRRLSTTATPHQRR